MRRRDVALLLGAAPLLGLGGCGSVPAPRTGSAAAAADELRRCASAHGADAHARLSDVSVAYEGHWHALVSRIQPVLSDTAHRQSSEERLLLREDTMAQRHRGPAGMKTVRRRGDAVEVFYGDAPEPPGERLDAAALVIDAYRLFLLAPFELAAQSRALALGDDEAVDGRRCAVVVAAHRGLGWRGGDTVAAYVDRDDGLLRRLRFTIDALASTRGAVVDVDFSAHRRIAGVAWPGAFFERVIAPLPRLPAHEWRLTGLDVDRGLVADDLAGADWRGPARRPARPLADA